MRGYGGTRFVWNLVMSTLSAATIISQPRVEVILQQLAATSPWYMTQKREHHEYEVDARVRRHEFVWNLVMSALSAPSKRSDAVSDVDRVDAAHVAESVVVELSAVERHRQRTDRVRVSPSASSQARRRWRTVDLGSKDLRE